MKTPPLTLWNIDAAVEPLAGGHRNMVFRTSGLEQNFVLKTTRRGEDALRWLSPVWDAAEHAGFVVPRMMFSKNGLLADHGWTCEPYLQGAHMPETEMKRLTPMIQHMHLACTALPQRPGFLAVAGLLTKDQGGDVDLSAMPSDLVKACRTHWINFADLPQTALHGDLNPGNVLKLENRQIALLDWDEARKDAPIFDLGPLGDTAHKKARLAWEIACSWQVEPEHAKHLASYLR